jgi:hypothetical protein
LGSAAVLSVKPPEGGSALVPPKSLIDFVTGPVKLQSSTASPLGENPLELFLHSFQRYALVCETSGRTYLGPGTAPCGVISGSRLHPR